MLENLTSWGLLEIPTLDSGSSFCDRSDKSLGFQVRRRSVTFVYLEHKNFCSFDPEWDLINVSNFVLEQFNEAFCWPFC
jgi:hypothetical protein